MDLKQIGKRLLALRKENNFTQAELAIKLGVTHQSISKWENGLHLPDIEMILQLSKLYGVTLEYILEGEKSTPNTNESNLDSQFVKIDGLITNIITFLLLIPVGWFIITVKLRWMNEPFFWGELFGIGILTFLTTFIIGLLVHELIKYFIYKLFGVKGVSIRFFKDGFIFLYCSEPISVRQARYLWIIPYLVYIPIMVISIFFFNIYFCMGIAILLMATSDDLIMYRYLSKENPDTTYIQAKDFLGYRCIDK